MSLYKIEVRTGNYLEQIKLTFRDGTKEVIGSDKGKLENLTPIMIQGEYVNKVSHEKFKNGFSIGLGITFYTNKGRKFDFYTTSLSTRLESEMVHLSCKDGYEIVNLKIRKGTLVDIKTKKIDSNQNSHNINYVISYYDEKLEDIIHQSFDSNRLKNKWLSNNKIKEFVVFDFVKCKILENYSKTDKIINSAIEHGYYIPNMYKKVNKWNVLYKIFREVTTFRDLIPLFVTNILLTLANYFSLTSNLIMGKLLTLSNKTIEDNTLLNTLIPVIDRKDYRENILLILIIIVLLENIFKSLNTYIIRKFRTVRGKETERKNLKHLLSLDQSFFDTNNKQEINSSMNSSKFNHIIGWSIPTTFHKIIHLFMIIYFMGCINIKVTFMTCSIMLILKTTVLEFLRKRNENNDKLFSKVENFIRQVEERPKNMMDTVKQFGSEKYHIRQYESVQWLSNDMSSKANLSETQFYFTYHMLEVICFTSIVYTGLKLLDSEIISAENLTSFFLTFKEFQTILGHVNWHIRTLEKEFPDIEKYNWFLNCTPKLIDGKKEYNFNEDIICLENIGFRYPSRPENKILDGLNLRFEKGKTTAIVGETGSGKSTISKLICRLYDPEEGKVTLGGIDIREYKLKTMLKYFSIVSQKPDFFTGTIQENLIYSLERKISQEELIEVCKQSGCYQFIMDLPYKFETLIFENNFSGGQKQRLSLARAILRRPEFLVLDEATSALDSETEYSIVNTLNKIMKNKTVIVIAHRLSTIKNADNIICLKDGKIVESGTHQKLIKSNGYYKKLIEKQI